MGAEVHPAPSVRCKCGHNPEAHELPGFDGECVREGCRCQAYQSHTITAPVARPTPIPVTVEQVLRVAKAFGDKRAKLTAARVDLLVDELRALLAADRARDEAALVAAQIKEAFKAHNPQPGKRHITVEYGEFPCPELDCGFVAKARIGLGPHRAKAHGYRKAG